MVMMVFVTDSPRGRLMGAIALSYVALFNRSITLLSIPIVARASTGGNSSQSNVLMDLLGLAAIFYVINGAFHSIDLGVFGNELSTTR